MRKETEMLSYWKIKMVARHQDGGENELFFKKSIPKPIWLSLLFKCFVADLSKIVS